MKDSTTSGRRERPRLGDSQRRGFMGFIDRRQWLKPEVVRNATEIIDHERTESALSGLTPESSTQPSNVNRNVPTPESTLT